MAKRPSGDSERALGQAPEETSRSLVAAYSAYSAANKTPVGTAAAAAVLNASTLLTGRASASPMLPAAAGAATTGAARAAEEKTVDSAMAGHGPKPRASVDLMPTP